jgi:hypothetical protein
MKGAISHGVLTTDKAGWDWIVALPTCFYAITAVEFLLGSLEN